MELISRLKRSDEKNKDIRKSVKKYLTKTLNLDLINMCEKTSYSGPVIEKCVAYNNKFYKQLRKIFESTPHEDRDAGTQSKSLNYKEKMSKIYSENSHLIRKKQELSIREDTLKPVVKKRRRTLIREPSKTNRLSVKEKSPFRNQLYFPVLSTIGNYELRNRVYKLK